MRKPQDEAVKRELNTVEDYGNYYGHVQYCQNCRQKNVAYIKKGIHVSGNSVECDKCGCSVELKP